jgi:hypothetical protein
VLELLEELLDELDGEELELLLDEELLEELDELELLLDDELDELLELELLELELDELLDELDDEREELLVGESNFLIVAGEVPNVFGLMACPVARRTTASARPLV